MEETANTRSESPSPELPSEPPPKNPPQEFTGPEAVALRSYWRMAFSIALQLLLIIAFIGVTLLMWLPAMMIRK